MKPERSPNPLLQRVGLSFAVLFALLFLARLFLPSVHPAPHRFRIARAKSDLRHLASGIEAYTLAESGPPVSLDRLSTPMAYMERRPSDKDDYPIAYYIVDSNWFLVATGPDRTFQIDVSTTVSQFTDLIYDPTNGVLSSGDLVRTTFGIFEP